jgi:hypothetical protein
LAVAVIWYSEFMHLHGFAFLGAKRDAADRRLDICWQNQDQQRAQQNADESASGRNLNCRGRDEFDESAGVNNRQPAPIGKSERNHRRHRRGLEKMAQSCEKEDARDPDSPAH